MPQTENLPRLVYASRATQEMSFNRVLTIIAKSRSVNKVRDVTGMLLYDGGVFVQVLEGAPETVRGLYAAIERDPRHHSLKVLLEEQTRTRLFCGWSMGHSGATAKDIAGLPGMSDAFLDGHDLDRLGETQVRALLEAFRKGTLTLQPA